MTAPQGQCDRLAAIVRLVLQICGPDQFEGLRSFLAHSEDLPAHELACLQAALDERERGWAEEVEHYAKAQADLDEEEAFRKAADEHFAKSPSETKSRWDIRFLP
jgi:hypothetical protein